MAMSYSAVMLCSSDLLKIFCTSAMSVTQYCLQFCYLNSDLTRKVPIRPFVLPHLNTYFVTWNHWSRVPYLNGTSYVRGFTSLEACHGMLLLNIVSVNEKISSKSSKYTDTKWNCVNSMFVRCFRELIAPVQYSFITSFRKKPSWGKQWIRHCACYQRKLLM